MLKLGIKWFKKYVWKHSHIEISLSVNGYALFVRKGFRFNKSHFSCLLEKIIWYYIYLFVCESAYLLVFLKTLICNVLFKACNHEIILMHTIYSWDRVFCKIGYFQNWVFCRPTYMCLEKLWDKSNNKKWINATNDVSNLLQRKQWVQQIILTIEQKYKILK